MASSGRTIKDDYPTHTPVRVYYDDGSGDVLKMTGFVMNVTEGQKGAKLEILSGDFLLRRRDDIFVSYTAEDIAVILQDLIENYCALEWLDYGMSDTDEWHLTGAGQHPNDQSEDTECHYCRKDCPAGVLQLAYGSAWRDNFLNEEDGDVPDNWVPDGGLGNTMDTIEIDDEQAATNTGRKRSLKCEEGAGTFGYAHHDISHNTDDDPIACQIYLDENTLTTDVGGIILQDVAGNYNVGNILVYIEARNGGLYYNDGLWKQILATFSTDTWHSIVIYPNYTANTFTVDVNGTNYGPYNFKNAGASTESIQLVVKGNTVWYDDFTVGEYETSGDWESDDFADHDDPFTIVSITTDNCDVNNYIDKIEVLNDGVVVATYGTNIITDGITALQEADFTGTLTGTTGDKISIKIYLVGDGSDTPRVDQVRIGSNVQVVNNNSVTREWRGTRLDQIIQELATLSGNEAFGATDDLVFYFKPRDLTAAPLSFSDNNILMAEEEEDETEAVDRVVIYYNSGANAVTVTRFDRAADNQTTVGTVRPIMRTASYDHPEITAEADAIEKGEAYLNRAEPLNVIYVDTINFPDLSPGQVVPVTSSDLHIATATEYVITKIIWNTSGQTKVTLLENYEGVIDILNMLQTEKTRVDMKTSSAAVAPVETNRLKQPVKIKVTALKMYIPDIDDGFFRFGDFGEGFGVEDVGGKVGSPFNGYTTVLDETY